MDFTDTFDRTASTLGADWTNVAAGWSTNGTQAAGTTSGNQFAALTASAAAYTGDNQSFEFVVSGIAVTQGVLQLSSGGTAWYGLRTTSTTLGFTKSNDTFFGSTFTHTLAAGDVFRIDYDTTANNLKAYKNGTLVLTSAALASPLTGNRLSGLRATGTAARVDSVRAKDLAASSTPSATAAFTNTPALTASATPVASATAAFTSTPALAASGTPIVPAGADFIGMSGFGATAVPVSTAVAAFTNAPALTATAQAVGQPLVVPFTSTPVFSATAVPVARATAAFASGGVLTAEAHVPTGGGFRPRPTRVPSYGPNGTHWALDTPWLYEVAPNDIEVDCTWAAIAAAINGLTAAQVNDGVRIRVRPGSLPGNGASQGSTPVINTVGDVSWAKRVLVMARDGWGSVTMSDSIRIHRAYRINWALFDGQGFQFTGCTGGACSWTTGTAQRLSGVNGQQTFGFEFFEWVTAEAKVSDSDPTNWSGGTGTGVLYGCSNWGCYSAPSYRPLPQDTDGDGTNDIGYGHNDTHQLQTGGADYWGFTHTDTTLFGSTNSAQQLGGWGAGADARVAAITGRPESDPIEFFSRTEHSLLIDGYRGSRRYPVPTEKTYNADGSVASYEAEPLDSAACTNGSGRVGSHEALDSIMVGVHYYVAGKARYQKVRNTRVTDNRVPVTDGAWTLDPTLADLTAADFDTMSPYPTTDYLQGIWASSTTTAPTDPGTGTMTDFSDDFNRIAATGLGTNYTVVNSGWNGNGSAAATTNSGTQFVGVTGAPFAGASQSIEAVFASATGNFALLLQVANDATAWLGLRFNGAAWAFTKSNDTNLGTGYSGHVPVAGDKVRFDYDGISQGKAYWNDETTPFLTYTYPTPLTGNRIAGLRANGAGTQIDSIRVKDITVANDTTPPAVAFTNPTPADGSTVTGSITIAGTATDETTTITGVQVFLDGSLIASPTVSGGAFSTTLNTSSYSNGSHTLSVKATDGASVPNSTTISRTYTVSNTVSDTTPPTVPGGFTVTALDSAVRFDWTASSDTSPGVVAGYTIFRNNVSVATPAASATTYTLSGLTNGTAFDWNMDAFDNASPANHSARTATYTVAPTATPAPDTTAPSVPAITSLVPGDSQVTVNYSAATDNVAVKDYVITRTVGGTDTVLAPVNSPTLTLVDTGLTNGTPVTYAVQARDAAGNISAKSGTSTTTPVAAVSTGVPTTYYDTIVVGGVARERVSPRLFADDTGNLFQFEGITLTCRGDSGLVVQSNANCAQAELMPARLQKRLGIATLNNYGTNSDTASDMALRMLDNSKPYVLNAIETMLLLVGGNDWGTHHTAATGEEIYTNGVETALSLRRAASVVEAETGTATGTWTTVSGGACSGGAYTASTVPGSTRTISVPAGKGTLILLAPIGGGSAYTVSLGGTQIANSTTKLRALSALNDYGSRSPVPIQFNNTTGAAANLVVTHTGASGDALWVDCVLFWSATPAQSLVIQPGKPPNDYTESNKGYNVYPSPKPNDADVDRYRSALATMLARMPQDNSIRLVLLTSLDGNTRPLMGNDGLHLSSKGHSALTTVVMQAMQTVPWRTGMHRMINT